MPSPGTSLSALRGAGCLPPVVLVVCPRSAACLPSGCWLPARGAGCLPLGALCLARTASFAFPMPFIPLPEHKNADFVLEMPENKGFRGKKRTKNSILCSKSPKMRVPKAKSAQKPRFCARNAQKWGFQTPKKHKNLDFVLEKTGIGIGKSNRGLPANHRARFKNSNVS